MLAHQRTKRIKSRKTKNIPANPKIQKSNPWKETQMPAHKKSRSNREPKIEEARTPKEPTPKSRRSKLPKGEPKLKSRRNKSRKKQRNHYVQISIINELVLESIPFQARLRPESKHKSTKLISNFSSIDHPMLHEKKIITARRHQACALGINPGAGRYMKRAGAYQGAI